MRFVYLLAALATVASISAPMLLAGDVKNTAADDVSVLVQTAAVKRGGLPRIVVADGTATTKPP